MIKYKIFGKVVEFQVEQSDKVIIENLKTQFDYYDFADQNAKTEILIEIVKSSVFNNCVAVNPSIHGEKENGFVARYRNYDVNYQIDEDRLKFTLTIKHTKNALLRLAKKINNIEFVSREERIPQIIVESILVPAVFFDLRKFIVHSSSFMNPDGEVILLGGTGGVGKTSLGIEFCTTRKYKFVNDDIAVLDEDANIYPNLALPKIYSYNLVGNKPLKKKIFSSRSLADRFIFELKKIIQGPSKVRRKIDLESVYSGYIKNAVKAGKYFILTRQNVEKLSIEEVSAELASKINFDIIQAEYSQFFNHLSWHKFNSAILNKNTILTNEKIKTQMLDLGEKAFKKMDCFIVKIPIKIDHKKFVKELADLIETTE
ncbi:MAG: hypothetical protein JEY94_18535 [Melioribacteraceae bacterium]|nr:hypothetical protein [Melioribacteraceae bacterium]